MSARPPCEVGKPGMVFTCLSGWKQIQRRIFCDMLKLDEILILVSISSFIGTLPHLFFKSVVCTCYCAVTSAELNGCDRDHVACKASNIYCLALWRASLPTPGVD